MMSSAKQQQPHALMFPYPVQGHINPMLQLATRMLDEGFYITFVNTDQNHERMFGRGKNPSGEAAPEAVAAAPSLRFEHIPDGMPAKPDHVNQTGIIVEMTTAMLALPGPLAKLVRRIMARKECPPLTCIVADAFFSWAQDVADIFRVPRIAFWTTPVHANLAYTFMSTLQSHGLIPVTDKSKLQETVECIEGIAPMKLEDYICFYLIENPTSDFLFQWHLRLGMKRPQEAAWNLGNNFEALEHEACSAFKKVVPNFLPIGPLLQTDIPCNNRHNIASTGVSLMPEDATCSDWLSQHEKASVIYVSFGSMVNMPEEELAEIILGLERSSVPFLLVIRPDQPGAVLSELREKLDVEAAQLGKPSHRALIVSWAPQLEVLSHPSIGIFLSHCGWNSLIESILAGVPILAKPGGFAEQRMNAHYIAEVWKIGHRLPDRVTASIVQSTISSLLGSSLEVADVQRRVFEVRQLALDSLTPPGGSSICNFKRFIDDMYRCAAAGSSQDLRPSYSAT